MITGTFEVCGFILITAVAIPDFMVMLISDWLGRLWRARMLLGKGVNTRLLPAPLLIRA